eukprot:TRINITY_DN509_c0_g1_i1.p1 TRINITY_DN509_c0_g1~~TRINITY_DN509_c0_g1_i1.p1  ORF type:complete len:303 (-),score=28.78 TRINITY_DN509_c0_g1_i1:71-979(-)
MHTGPLDFASESGLKMKPANNGRDAKLERAWLATFLPPQLDHRLAEYAEQEVKRNPAVDEAVRAAAHWDIVARKHCPHGMDISRVREVLLRSALAWGPSCVAWRLQAGDKELSLIEAVCWCAGWRQCAPTSPCPLLWLRHLPHSDWVFGETHLRGPHLLREVPTWLTAPVKTGHWPHCFFPQGPLPDWLARITETAEKWRLAAQPSAPSLLHTEEVLPPMERHDSMPHLEPSKSFDDVEPHDEALVDFMPSASVANCEARHYDLLQRTLPRSHAGTDECELKHPAKGKYVPPSRRLSASDWR